MVRGERGRIGENQATKITTEAEAERLVIELVGDLAAYRPGAKVVLFEGGGDVELDVLVVTRLFPSFADRTNLIAAGNKRQVLALHTVLDSLNADALGARFYAVHDRDSGPPAERAARQFEWDRYHIENYLLEPGYVLRALAELTVANHALADADAVKGALRESARRTVKRLVRHELQVFATDAFRNTLRIGAEHSEGSVADALRPSIDGARERVVHLVDSELSPSELSKREQQLEESFVADLDSDAWMKKFRGRDVLRDFVSHHVPGVSYETVRDLVLARMKDDGFEPPGMAQVLDQIVADRFP
jgi:hypothetical protein